MNIFTRGLGGQPADANGSFSPGQVQAIQIVGVASASISLFMVLVAFGLFLSMRKSFRHHLILALVMSDMAKSMWYLIYPVVIFTRGQPQNSSAFCQASGFFVAWATEASDYAILMIALHAALYIFRPPKSLGEAGLYDYRYWIYPLWVALPVLAASLAFTNPGDSYVNMVSYCYLPKRPFWYRLALAWIPRYIIFITIFALYAGIYIYVHVKFKGFGNHDSDVSNYGLGSDPQPTPERQDCNRLHPSPESTVAEDAVELDPHSRMQSVASVSTDPNKPSEDSQAVDMGNQTQVWENVDFLTSPSSTHPSLRLSQLSQATLSPNSNHGSGPSSDTRPSTKQFSLRFADTLHHRGNSEAPTFETNLTGDTLCASHNRRSTHLRGSENQLNTTRLAIRRQLRFLFIYPVVYVIMWILPFVSHCLQYSDHYSANPPFWLTICVTAILALQAGVDAAIFSWREKPWRRINSDSTGLIHAFSRSTGRLFDRGGADDKEEEMSSLERTSTQNSTMGRGLKKAVLWWEEEGRKRRDSVWMGTDVITDLFRGKEGKEGKDDKDAAREESNKSGT